MTYTIIRVYDGITNTYNYREMLRSEMFEFNKKSYGKSYWEKKIINDGNEDLYLNSKENEFKKVGLKILILSPENRRSNNYRKLFFENNKGFIGKYYFCSYCGKVCRSSSITIDHIFPINKTSKSMVYKYFLKKLKINDINDIRNLAPACKSCNSRKASKTGLWLIRGFIGKYSATWFVIWLITIISLVYLIIKIY